jgi:hypothetical protein
VSKARISIEISSPLQLGCIEVPVVVVVVVVVEMEMVHSEIVLQDLGL